MRRFYRILCKRTAVSELKSSLMMSDQQFVNRYNVAKPQAYHSNIVFYGLGPIKSTAAIELARKYGYKKYVCSSSSLPFYLFIFVPYLFCITASESLTLALGFIFPERRVPHSGSVCRFASCRILLKVAQESLGWLPGDSTQSEGVKLKLSLSFHNAVGQLYEALRMPSHKFESYFGVQQPSPNDDNIVFTCLGGIRSHKALLLSKDLGYRKYVLTFFFNADSLKQLKNSLLSSPIQ